MYGKATKDTAGEKASILLMKKSTETLQCEAQNIFRSKNKQILQLHTPKLGLR